MQKQYIRYNFKTDCNSAYFNLNLLKLCISLVYISNLIFRKELSV